MKHIVLIGYMGAGKTKVGEALSKRLAIPFVDMDAKIEEENHMEIKEIFQKYGESYFRQLETKTLKEIASWTEAAVVSTGGGLPMQEENHSCLKKMGTVIYLKAQADTLEERLKGDTTRPLLQGTDLKQRIIQMLAVREPVYEALADLVIETDRDSFDCLLEKIVEKSLQVL